MTFSTRQLKQQASDLGFSFAGVIRAAPAPTLDAYFRWIEAEMHGSMGYMARPDRQARRRDLNVILPGVQSMILVGLDYRTLDIPESVLSDPSRGRIAMYAWGLDYHDWMTPRLEALAAWLQAEAGQGIGQRVYVDTGAVLERAHAQQAGLGFIGKNTLLIHPRRGSFFFLGEMLTDLVFDVYDTPGHATMCGSCTRCLNACPTDAFPQPYVLDARRCISYLTIEHKTTIDPELRPMMGNWVFGCDICQTVCPWQRFSLPTPVHELYPVNVDRAAPPLLDLLTLDEHTFTQRFAGSPIERIKRARLVRNACVAAGNWGDVRTLPALTALLHDDDALVREHAAWAVERITTPG
ncbi:MAG: tRNA epoxyqueuosine(34) reductase QueG [Anaerolineae bacterium]